MDLRRFGFQYACACEIIIDIGNYYVQRSCDPSPSAFLASTMHKHKHYHSIRRKLPLAELFRSDALRCFGFHVREAVYAEPLERKLLFI